MSNRLDIGCLLTGATYFKITRFQVARRVGGSSVEKVSPARMSEDDNESHFIRKRY
jgi:hypothetical protein